VRCSVRARQAWALLRSCNSAKSTSSIAVGWSNCFPTGLANCFRSMPYIPPASIGRRKSAPSLISPSTHLRALLKCRQKSKRLAADHSTEHHTRDRDHPVTGAASSALGGVQRGSEFNAEHGIDEADVLIAGSTALQYVLFALVHRRAAWPPLPPLTLRVRPAVRRLRGSGA
jgi:hypothetical protein